MILRQHNPYKRATRSLQGQLRHMDCDPGPLDGIYGPSTARAVLEFQGMRQLVTDGIAGPQTFSALSIVDDLPFDPWAYLYLLEPSHIQSMFPEVPQNKLRLYLPHVWRGLERANLMYQPLVVIALATIRAETAGFEPISEHPSRFNTPVNGPKFGYYDARSDLGNEGHPDGERYRGRGFVQLTGRANYRVYGHRLGLDLEEEPDRANEPRLAGMILGAFLKDRERRLVQLFENKDFIALRRLVNGGSHGFDRFSKALEMSTESFCEALESGCGCLF